ncbi:lipopolysaccharide biosynthesis protein [Hymenobacter actinosclerus]|uniref:Membrane protein involved in the export of O-antigen and teichoic acid n=1 Tax=Hymenobacter actinosclerus TaxID=82805 RepID=A0A1H9ZKB4_9BACT|nr:polysaccharide biosynthesis C-terminal domain-containing protein [Hymenobacter actinosclerus]SES81965.1 Membrane protein involved in the export of O-antigen and teichoic acid [Hymenobacter actinosclerus]
MLRRVVQNFTTRLATALISFGIVWLTARYLGAAGRGAVSLFVTDCAAILLFIGLLGGSSLIYLAPRRNLWHLLLPAYGWAALVCAVGTAAVGLLRQPGPGYLLHLGLLSLLQAFFSINTALLLGRRRETIYNLLTLAQVALLAGALLAAFWAGGRWVAVETYYYAAYLAFGLPWLLSLGPLLRLPDPRRRHGRRLRATTRELARHSRGAHFSNILSFVNYRLGYYFVAYFADARAVGVLSVGVSLMEAIWLIPRSAALVQYVDLVNSTSTGPLPDSALRVGRLAVLGTAVAVLVLVAMPPAVLTATFGREFGPAQAVMRLLAPGVVIMAVQMLITSYFSGRARYRLNNMASLVGLVVTVAGGLLLIPRLGIAGAALASTFSYAASTAFLVWHFRRVTGLGITAFLPGPTDVARAWQLLRQR